MKKILIGILLFAMVSGIPFASIMIAKFVADFNVDGGGFAIAQGIFLIIGLIVSLFYYTQND
jgi:hypothetical protein